VEGVSILNDFISPVHTDALITNYKRKSRLMKQLTNRFSTYGFSQISTSTFENYDSYMRLHGTVETNEMIKTIDHTGNVLALRSDATIPITEQLMREHQNPMIEKRYFYVLDVFRYPVSSAKPKENTQAGIECFGASGIETDAEIIALAMHILIDLNRPSYTLEISHAGFFERCISVLELSTEDRNTLKKILQTKNMGELKQFLMDIQIDANWKQVLELIPLLYGEPLKVIELVRNTIDDPIILKQMDQFEKLYEILTAYDLASDVVIDLSLMNHMDYYSDIIFQGFIHNVGKPVLMGGRYNHLTAHFGSSTPAIGFACDVDAIVSSEQEEDVDAHTTDVGILQTEETFHHSLSLATYLRDAGWSTRTMTNDCPSFQPIITCTFIQNDNKQIIQVTDQQTTKNCTSFKEVKSYIQKCMQKET